MREGCGPLRVEREVEDDHMTAGRKRLLPLPLRPLEVDQVHSEDRQALTKIEAPAGEAPALRDQHAVRPALRHLDLCGDAEGAVEDVRRRVGLGAAGRASVDELPAAGPGAGPRRDHVRDGVVQWEDLVARRLHHEDFLHRPQAVGLRRGEVAKLRRIVREVVELPSVAVHHVGRQRCGHAGPGCRGGRRAGDPAVVVDRAVAEDLEILRPAARRRGGRLAGEGIGHVTPSSGRCAMPLIACG